VRRDAGRQDARLSSGVIRRVNEVTKDLRESVPLLRNNLHARKLDIRGSDRIQAQTMMARISEAVYSQLTATKDGAGSPRLPSLRSGFRKERIGSVISHRLRDSAKSVYVNVGGSGMDAKVSSPPMTCQSVGGVIVLGGRESRPHGEGRQLVGISTQNSRMPTQGNP
jgi:hypothetical protein